MMALLWRQDHSKKHSSGSDLEAAKPGQDATGGGGTTPTAAGGATTNNNNSLLTMTSGHVRRPSLTGAGGLDRPPLSRSLSAGHLPLLTTKLASPQGPEPKLIHPLLKRISITTRFALNGLLSNVLFMWCYNWCIETFTAVAPPTMYSVVYLIFIPINHAMVSLFVFGWPDRYVPSLMSNFPIGLTAIGLGGGLTAWLDSIHFNESVAEYIRSNYSFHRMPGGVAGSADEGEFYSSIVVLMVTSIWTFLLSLYVNTTPEQNEKKEL